MPFKLKEDHYRANALSKQRLDIQRKTAIFLRLGNKCCKCGFDDQRAFNIDHINGGGTAERAKFGSTYYKRVLDKLVAGSREYQLLCANCNQIKRHTNAELGRRSLYVKPIYSF